MKYQCPSCNYYTFNKKSDGSYDICKVCFWGDDPVQLEDPAYEGGASWISLIQATKNYKEFGACQREMTPYVRSHIWVNY